MKKDCHSRTIRAIGSSIIAISALTLSGCEEVSVGISTGYYSHPERIYRGPYAIPRQHYIPPFMDTRERIIIRPYHPQIIIPRNNTPPMFRNTSASPHYRRR